MNKKEIITEHSRLVGEHRVWAGKLKGNEDHDPEAIRAKVFLLDQNISILGQVHNARISRKSLEALT